jgi:D-lactate dehydrogenase
MSCGVEANTYRSLASMVMVLTSGTVIDTAEHDAGETLRIREPAIHAGLIRLRDRVRSDRSSVAVIRSLFSIKNTMGYSLNAFLDFDEPIDILQHLIVGSEGTLAFVASATFRTLPIHPYAGTGLLVFPSLADATAALPSLVAAGFATIELMDSRSLRAAQADPAAGDYLRSIDVKAHAALLVEIQEPDPRSLAARMDEAAGRLAQFPLTHAPLLTSDPATRAALWHIRKGLYALVAGSRPSGTSALLEDIAVPVDRLLPTCDRLVELFDVFGYEGSVIFGHAKDGNIHFMLNEHLDEPDGVARLSAFTEELVQLVLQQGGTLKAEHGTGRMMAPFVRRQYGDELYDVMVELKRLMDPPGVLGADVIITDDPQLHIKNLKPTAQVEPEVDRCVECGYCEPVCPSRDLTLTPRQRIVLRREMALADIRGDRDLLNVLRRDFEYDGVQTCAVDGMCETACPVGINTGDLVRRLRAENHTVHSAVTWTAAARHWAKATRAGGAALTLAAVSPPAVPRLATIAARALLGKEVVPQYSRDLPRGGRARKDRPAAEAGAEAVYFAACVHTMFAPAAAGAGASFERLCQQAGISLRTPQDIGDLCCGTPWKSKGLDVGYGLMQHRVAKALIDSSENGRLPIVVDASSCSEGLGVLLDAHPEIRVTDAIEFVDQRILPTLPPLRKLPSIVVHPTCSSTRLALNPALSRIAAAVAERVIIPDDWSCCAFAGDRGMLHPELTASATAAEALATASATSAAYVSVNRTCEIGMTRATGKRYLHILEVLESCLEHL